MSGTYKATGINLKATPLGESDRLLTVLTAEYGLVRAVAPGSRKHKSSLGGRSGLFVINNLLIAQGRSLDKIVQAESIESFPGLSQNLAKLTAAQYLAELVLCQALSDQPQIELFNLLQERLTRLEQRSETKALAELTHATFQCLILAGVAPQVDQCCVTMQPVIPDRSDTQWRIGFSAVAGGTVQLAALDRLVAEQTASNRQIPQRPQAAERGEVWSTSAQIPNSTRSHRSTPSEICMTLDAPAALLLQQLADPTLNLDLLTWTSPVMWQTIERVLRQYAQFHFDRPIRSAALIESCFIADPSLVES